MTQVLSGCAVRAAIQQEKAAMNDVTLERVESSLIHAIGHDAATNTLAIQFRSKVGPGATYHYDNFSAEQFEEFKRAQSIGKYFGAFIKDDPRYPFTRVADAPA